MLGTVVSGRSIIVLRCCHHPACDGQSPRHKLRKVQENDGAAPSPGNTERLDCGLFNGQNGRAVFVQLVANLGSLYPPSYWSQRNVSVRGSWVSSGLCVLEAKMCCLHRLWRITLLNIHLQSTDTLLYFNHTQRSDTDTVM
ncbi:hypothetical protein INR49_025072 [Caranx melampygus]|nr:hypothetical protein INR49_025072 [Caranx melampygus]